ncbi:MAG: serine/threonine-protein phosphatase [Planctomycetaceae bacterium]|nr:serine/threonine-protein phosphatase [Planctomycetaceae bacterium]
MALEARWGAVSITGNFRENNEDRCLADASGRFFIVADGMGGQCAGEKASAMAVELVPQRLVQLLDFSTDQGPRVAHAIDDAVAHANGEIMALSELDPEFHNMGTTLALAVRAGDRFYVAGIGDSRVYVWQAGQLRKLTTDHSLTQALLDAGTISIEEAARHRYRNVLYRYLGTKEGGSGANAVAVDIHSGDRLLLCSDGATDGLSESALAEIVSQHTDPQQAAQAVVDAAQQAGSRDNITCLAVFVS